MFVPFQRLGDTDNTTGVGLGLALSRGLTEAMGGSLEPEDTPGGGLTMALSLPAVPGPAEAMPGSQEREAGRPRATPPRPDTADDNAAWHPGPVTTVLVVDDEPQILRALRINLRVRQYDVHTAGSGSEALEVAAQHPPDLVILDLGLPDLDGVEVIHGLRGWTEAPIIVLSGRADSTDKVEALDAGADDYVTKPFGMDELLARMRAVSRRAGGRRATRRRSGSATSSSTWPPSGYVRRSEAKDHKDQAGNGDVRLTPTEWHLLEVLLRNPGKLLSQQQLLAEVWGPGYADAAGNLRLYMAQLRRKLEPDPARPRWLMTEPGMGYRYQPDPDGV